MADISNREVYPLVEGGEAIGVDSQGRTRAFNSSGDRPYKVYVALISQTGTEAPTAQVVENSIGTIVWTRQSEGIYIGTLINSFTENKTVCFVSGNMTGGDATAVAISRETNNSVIMYTYDSAPTLSEMLTEYPMSLEIRVYS